jgi:hypothetical protein
MNRVNTSWICCASSLQIQSLSEMSCQGRAGVSSPRGRYHQRGDLSLLVLLLSTAYPLQNRYHIRQRLPRTSNSLKLSQNLHPHHQYRAAAHLYHAVLVLHGTGYRPRLHRRCPRESHITNDIKTGQVSSLQVMYGSYSHPGL